MTKLKHWCEGLPHQERPLLDREVGGSCQALLYFTLHYHNLLHSWNSSVKGMPLQEGQLLNRELGNRCQTLLHKVEIESQTVTQMK